MAPKKIYYVYPHEPAPAFPADLLLYLDAGNSSSYPGSGSTWADLTSNGNDFTLNGSFAHNAAFGGGCMEFEGSGEYAEFANGNGVFSVPYYTVIVWFYYTSLESIMGLWSYDFTSHSFPFYAQHLRVSGSNLNVQWNIGGVSFGGPLVPSVFSPGNWYQVALSAADNGTNVSYRVYINGAQVGSTNNALGPTYYNQEVWIGRLNFDNTQNGKFSIVKFYSRGLDGAEILNDYETHKSRFGLL